MEDSPPSFPAERLQAQAAWMRRLVRPLVRDDPAADDVVQDTWLAALRHPPVQAGRMRAWLRKVAVRRAWEVRRSEKRRSQREERATAGEDAPAAVEVVERAEIHARVVEALLGLPEIYRAALLLRFFDDHSVARIARELEIPAATVRTRLHRGLGLLRNRLQTVLGEDWRTSCGALLPAIPFLSWFRESWKRSLLMSMKTKAALGVVLLAVIGIFFFEQGIGGDLPALHEEAGLAFSPGEEGSSASTPAGRSEGREGLDAPVPPSGRRSGSVARHAVLLLPIPRSASIAGTRWRLASVDHPEVEALSLVLSGRDRLLVPEGRWNLSCEDSAWLCSPAEITVVPGEEIEVWVFHSASLEVRVVDSGGQPVSGASLAWSPGFVVYPEAGRPALLFETRTDLDGRGVLRDLPGPAGELFATAPGFLPHLQTLVDSWEGVLTLVLSPSDGARVPWKVTDAVTGAPLEGVRFFDLDHGGIQVGEPSDRDGVLTLPAWTRESSNPVLRAEGYVTRGGDADRIGEAVSLWPSLRVPVRVVDSRGDPVPGAKVFLGAGKEGDMPPLLVLAEPAPTGEDGRTSVELPALPLVTLLAYAHREVARARVAPRKDMEEVRLVLGAGPVLRLLVRDEEGRALAGASASAWVDGPVNESFNEQGDDQGVIVLPNPRDLTYLEVKAPGRVAVWLERNSDRSLSAEGDLVVTLFAPLFLSGRVATTAGKPVAGLRLFAWPENERNQDKYPGLNGGRPTGHPAWIRSRLPVRGATSAGDGAFRIGGLVGGPYRLIWHFPYEANPRGLGTLSGTTTSRSVVLPHEEDLEIEIVPQRQATLRVLDARSGLPLHDSQMHLLGKGGALQERRPGPSWQGWISHEVQRIRFAAGGHFVQSIPIRPGEKPLRLDARLLPARPATLVLHGEVDGLAGRHLYVAVYAGDSTPGRGRGGIPTWWGQVTVGDPASVPLRIPFEESGPLPIHLDQVHLDSGTVRFEPADFLVSPGDRVECRARFEPAAGD